MFWYFCECKMPITLPEAAQHWSTTIFNCEHNVLLWAEGPYHSSSSALSTVSLQAYPNNFLHIQVRLCMIPTTLFSILVIASTDISVPSFEKTIHHVFSSNASLFFCFSLLCLIPADIISLFTFSSTSRQICCYSMTFKPAYVTSFSIVFF